MTFQNIPLPFPYCYFHYNLPLLLLNGYSSQAQGEVIDYFVAQTNHRKKTREAQ